MSRVWSCNEWDPLEEVIVGNPLQARFPTPDLSSQLAEFPDRSLAEIPRGPFPNKIIEETEEDLNKFVQVLTDLGVTVTTPGDMAARRQIFHDTLGIARVLQLLSSRHHDGHRRSDNRNTQCHPQSRSGNFQLSQVADGVHGVRRKVVQRPQTHASGLAFRGSRPGRSRRRGTTSRRLMPQTSCVWARI